MQAVYQLSLNLVDFVQVDVCYERIYENNNNKISKRIDLEIYVTYSKKKRKEMKTQIYGFLSVTP